MKTEDTIPEDFESLEKYAPALAKIARYNPFLVPNGYFDELPELIKGQAFISSLSPDPGFTVPENYFTRLPGLISDQVEVNKKNTGSVPENYFNQLSDIIHSRIMLEGLNKEVPFTVPSGYFEELPGIILNHIKLEVAGKENTFKIPDTYFENLPSSILSTIKIKEISEKESFSIPGSYFEELPKRIQEGIHSGEKKKIQVISIFRKRYSLIAAAASIALLIGLYYTFGQTKQLISDNQVIQLASVERKAIVENAEVYGIDESSITDIISDLDTKSIEEKLNLDTDQRIGVEIMLDNSIDNESNPLGF